MFFSIEVVLIQTLSAISGIDIFEFSFISEIIFRRFSPNFSPNFSPEVFLVDFTRLKETVKNESNEKATLPFPCSFLWEDLTSLSLFLFFELKFVGQIVVPVVFDFVFTLQPANDNPGANTHGAGKSKDILFIKSPPLDECFIHMRGH